MSGIGRGGDVRMRNMFAKQIDGIIPSSLFPFPRRQSVPLPVRHALGFGVPRGATNTTMPASSPLFLSPVGSLQGASPVCTFLLEGGTSCLRLVAGVAQRHGHPG